MKTLFIVMLAAFANLLGGTSVMGAEGSGSVKIGYTYIDEEGNQSADQMSYNLYEGIGLSLTDWNYTFDNGIGLQANLQNITLNNRLMEMQLGKPGLFKVNASNSQYRRFYNFDGTRYTRRNMTNLRFSYNPMKHIELFGGYQMHDRHGVSELLPQSTYDTDVIDTMVRMIDYKQTRFTGGLKWDNRKSMVRGFFRGSKFDDVTELNNDQTGTEFNTVASTIVPGYEWIYLSGGYIYRKTELDNLEAQLTTHQGWGAVKLNLPNQFLAEYRLTYGYAERKNAEDRTVDNSYQLIALGKNFNQVGGIRAGYEMRLQDDFLRKVTSTGFQFEGWLKPTERLSFNGMFTTRSEETDEARRLLGDLDVTRHQFTAKYTDPTWGMVMIRWQQRTRENDPLYTEGIDNPIELTTPHLNSVNTKATYSALTPELTLHRADMGSLMVSYSMITGTYENVQDSVDYTFRDHVLTGTVTPRAFGPLTADFSASYFRSKRDNDLESFNLNFGLMYSFLKNHHLEVRYNVFNFDDYRTLGGTYTQYYTGNIVEVNLIKDLSF